MLSALAGGLTAFAVVKGMQTDSRQKVVPSSEMQFRTVNLSHDNWPDFTYAAETAVDAVVDLVTEEYRPLAEKAKDVAAGAVLIAAFFAAIMGCIIFLPKLALFFGLF